MALTPANAEVAVTGAVLVGLTSATAPATLYAATTGFTDLGLVGEDGITESQDGSTDQLRAWQNGQTVRTIKTDGSLTYEFTLLETNDAVVELYYGTTVTSGVYLIDAEATRERQSFIIDVIDGDELSRIYIADGEVVEVGERVFVNNEIAAYPVTVQAYKHATHGNAKVWSSRLGAPTEA